MKSQLVLGGRFRVFEDGSVNKVFDGVETPAKLSYACKNKKYATVSYMDGGKQRHAYVHRLVAAAFVPNPNSYPQVNHKDGNTRNNCAGNLEWCTPGMNVRHAYETGLINPMATSEPCRYCGEFTKAKDGICGNCRKKLMQEAKEIDRRAEQRDRYSKVDLSLLSKSERKYVIAATDGMFVSEIAAKFGVSRQCVSAALLFAEKKSRAGARMTKGQESQRISLLIKAEKAKSRIDDANAKYQIAKNGYEAAIKALELFDHALHIVLPKQAQDSA